MKVFDAEAAMVNLDRMVAAVKGQEAWPSLHTVVGVPLDKPR